MLMHNIYWNSNDSSVSKSARLQAAIWHHEPESVRDLIVGIISENQKNPARHPKSPIEFVHYEALIGAMELADGTLHQGRNEEDIFRSIIEALNANSFDSEKVVPASLVTKALEHVAHRNKMTPIGRDVFAMAAKLCIKHCAAITPEHFEQLEKIRDQTVRINLADAMIEQLSQEQLAPARNPERNYFVPEARYSNASAATSLHKSPQLARWEYYIEHELMKNYLLDDDEVRMDKALAIRDVVYGGLTPPELLAVVEKVIQLEKFYYDGGARDHERPTYTVALLHKMHDLEQEAAFHGDLPRANLWRVLDHEIFKKAQDKYASVPFVMDYFLDKHNASAVKKLTAQNAELDAPEHGASLA